MNLDCEPKRLTTRAPKRYPTYKDSGVVWLGEVPAHWGVRRLRTIAEMRVSNVDKHSRDGERPIRLCNYVDVYKTDRIRAGMPLMTATAASAEIEKFRLRPGDVLITKDSEAWNDIGVPALVEEAADNTVCGYHLGLLRPFSNCVSGGFLFRAVQSSAIACQFHIHANGVTRYGLTHNAIKSVWVPLPPPPEQADIVRFLDHADRRIQPYIRAKQKLIALLEESRAVLINDAVAQGLAPNADSVPTRSPVFPLLPRDWPLRRMRSLVQRVRRPISVRPDTEYREIGIRSWGKGIFHKDSVPGAVLGEKNVFRIEPGDFVLNIVFAWEGAVSVVSENETGMIASHRFPTFRPFPEVDVDYLLMVFQSQQGRRLMEVNSPGAAGRNRTLRLGQFLDEEIPLPTLDAQRAIVAAFRHRERRLADCVGRTRQAVQQLEGFRCRLIPDVVTGKLDVRAAVASLPEADPPTPEGDSDDGVDSQTGPERAAWQQAAEDDGALPDVTDAERLGNGCGYDA